MAFNSLRFLAYNKRISTGSDGEAASSYIYGEELSFLQTCSAAREGHNLTISLHGSQTPVYADFDQFYDYPIGDTEELQTAPPAKRKPTTPRFQVNSDINALDAKFLSVLEQQDDQWTQFGKFVGASLSQKSDKKKQRELCMKIHQLLNEYDSD